ncbi:MAG: SH3 domain-containing protein [Smithellaceae bacterium]|nr:SH3 domain-containing protein [Smithellaceae bacterium]
MFRHISLIICLVLLGVLFLNTTAEAQKSMTVQVQEGQLRTTPSHFGKITAKTYYGDRVTVLEEKGDWKRVSVENGRGQGWMHDSALTSKQTVLRAGRSQAGTSVSHGEIALAGKGFSEEVEKEYRKNNTNLDYAWINRMETIRISSGQMENFIKDGRLVLRNEGGRP